jgi:hypothetical protein
VARIRAGYDVQVQVQVQVLVTGAPGSVVRRSDLFEK